MAAEKGSPVSTAGSVARRDRLLEVGRRHFLARPYEEVSLDDIASEAGVSHGLLFHYFSNKRGFYREALRSFLERRPVVAHLDPGLEGRDRLRAGLEEHLDLVEDQASNYRLLLHGGPGSDEEIHAMLEGFRSRGVERILAGIGVDRPTSRQRIAVRGWVGFVEGAVQEWLAGGRDLDRAELVDLLAGSLANALQEAERGAGRSAQPE